MDRRSLIAGFAVVVPILGTTKPVFAAQPGEPGSNLRDLDQRHLNDTMRLGAASLLSSRIAQQKASSEAVRQFAEFESAEQETIAEAIKGIDTTRQKIGNAQGNLKPPANSELDGLVTAQDRDLLAKLDALKGGL